LSAPGMSIADRLKLSLALLFVAAGVAGFYLLGTSPLVLRVVSVLAGVALAVTAAYFTDPGRRFHAFSLESVEEARKVVWPTRKETLQVTGVVLLFVIAMALFLWLVDAGLLWLVKIIMGRGE
jgi:preprotein translocase subunit SecE